jgi:acyl-CoA thioester hydrolase
MGEATYDEIGQLPVSWSGAVLPEYVDHNGHMNIERYFEVHCLGLAVLFDVHFRVDDAYREERRQGLFTIEQHVRYVSEAVAGDRLTVHLRVLGRSEKVVHLMSYLLDASRRQLANTVELTAAHVGLVTRRATPFPPVLADRIDHQITFSSELTWDASTCGVMGPRRPREQRVANQRSAPTDAVHSALP